MEEKVNKEININREKSMVREFLIILLVIITPILHEIAHFIFFTINGIPATMY